MRQNFPISYLSKNFVIIIVVCFLICISYFVAKNGLFLVLPVMTILFLSIFPEIGIGFLLSNTFFLLVLLPVPQGYTVVTISAVCFVGIILYCILKGVFPKLYSKTYVVMYIFGALLLLSSLYTTSPYNYGFYKSKGFILFCLFPAVAISTLENSPRRLYRLLHLIILYNLIIAIPSCYKILLGEMGSFMRFVGAGILSDNPISPSSLAKATGLACITAMFLTLTEVSKLKRVIYLTIAFALVLTSLATGTRSVSIGLLFGFLILIFLLRKNILLRMRGLKIVSFSILLLFAFFILILYIVIFPPGVLERYQGLGTDVSSREHVIALEYAVSIFLNNPITGVGAGGFYTASNFFGYYPHNIIAEIATELGIIGIIIFLVFLFSVFQNVRQILNVDTFWIRKLGIWATAVFIFGLCVSMFTGDIYRNPMIWICGGYIEMLRNSANYKYSNRFRKVRNAS